MGTFRNYNQKKHTKNLILYDTDLLKKMKKMNKQIGILFYRVYIRVLGVTYITGYVSCIYNFYSGIEVYYVFRTYLDHISICV